MTVRIGRLLVTRLGMMVPLTRADLNQIQCMNCGEDHPLIVLGQACHENTAAIAFYDKKAGVLNLTCAVCNEVYAKIVVSPELVH